ncbi:DUF982 domain-containing protein [Ensifer sp. ENS07]|nr:DUF982 domain-containing protein [Ensifer sp. ENS07]
MPVYGALDFLEHEWPVRHGAGYERGIVTCRDALNRSVSSAVAREAFIGVCLEAGMATSTVAAMPRRSRDIACSLVGTEPLEHRSQLDVLLPQPIRQ